MLVFALTFAAAVAAMLAWRVVRSRRLIATPPSLATAVVLAAGAGIGRGGRAITAGAPSH